MSEKQPKVDFVGYPRVQDGMRYGSADRLAALAEFVKDSDSVLLGIPVILVCYEGCLGLFAANHNPLLLIGALCLALLGYMSIQRLVSTLARGMAWKKTVGHVSAFVLVGLGIGPCFDKGGLVVIVPLTIAIAGCLWMLFIANREVRRYGLKLRPFSAKSHHREFEEAIQVRRQWEQHPLPPVPPDLFSGSGPKA